jgi:transcriptional regulator
MYVPRPFKEDRIDILQDAICRSGLATLITMTADGLIASHVPLILDPEPAPYGTLLGHLARPNPQAKDAIGDALVIFQGPEGYVSPSWYAEKQTTGKVVPTWNYVAIHAYGPLELIEDPAVKRAHVTALTNRHEGARAKPWSVTDAPADFIATMLKGIVAFRIPITRLEGKWKLGQNRPADDRLGLAGGLEADGNQELADLVRATLP